MERAGRHQVNVLQEETKHVGPFPQGASFNNYDSANQNNVSNGTQNISQGDGSQFPGATFHGPVYFGTDEHFDPLRECSRSLAFPEMDSRLNDIDAAAKGTCEWLLRHQTCTSWASCDRGLLWIKGKPGSGKSTLLRYALDHVVAIPNTGEGALILSFLFHGRGTELQRTPLGLFRSLLHHLLQQVPDALKDLMATFRQRCVTVGKLGEKWQWHPRELQRFFESSLQEVLKTRTLWLFVDALDECGEENAVKLVEEFKSLLQRLSSTGLKPFHICFTCRHYPILDLDGVFEICLEEENEKDISTFVQDKLSSFQKRTSSTISNFITRRACGVFLWAWLVVNQVLKLDREGVVPQNIETKIHSIPQQLDALYRELIQNMGAESRKLVQWICFAIRPLSLDELRWAMAVEPDCRHRLLRECESAGDFPSGHDGMKRRVQTLSRGLIEVTSDAKVIQFIHQSVKDFFVEKGLLDLDNSGATSTDTAVGLAHLRLSRICLRYLAMEMKEIGPITDFPLLHYATTSWVAHTKQSDARSAPQEDLLQYFAGPSNTLIQRWALLYRVVERSGDCPEAGTSLVHVMSKYGVVGALRVILERADQVGIDIDGQDGVGRTPLSWAAADGHEVVVRLLLETGRFDAPWLPKAVMRRMLLVASKVNVDKKDRGGRTPLWYATKKGHEAVARLLLDRGADTEAAEQWGSRSTLLWSDIRGYSPGMRLFYYLAANHVRRGQTPLSKAAQKGHEAIVRLLLDRGARIEAADGHGWTPLRWAIERGHEAIVRLLLDRGACIESADKSGQTPLSRATKKGNEAIARLLSTP